MTSKERLDKFLEELTELSNKYGFVIGGCGCCGSPWVDEVDGDLWADKLGFVDGKYEVDI